MGIIGTIETSVKSVKYEEIPLISSLIEIWFGIYLLNQSPSRSIRVIEIALFISYLNSLFVFFFGYLFQMKINFYPIRYLIWGIYFMGLVLELFQVSYEVPS